MDVDVHPTYVSIVIKSKVNNMKIKTKIKMKASEKEKEMITKLAKKWSRMAR